MKLIFIVPTFPFPAHSGAQVAALETLRSLLPLCELHLLTPPADDSRVANERGLREILPAINFHYYEKRGEQPTGLQMYTTAAQAALTRQPYWQRKWLNNSLRATLRRLLTQEDFDVVHCDWLQPAVSLRGLKLPMVLRTLDVHFIAMQKRPDGLSVTDKLRKAYWRKQAERFRKFEVETLAAVPAVVTLSTEDELILRDEGLSNLVTIPPPYTVPSGGLEAFTSDTSCLALFIGRLDMPVNREAFFLFADQVWPRVRANYRSELRIVFAGGFPDAPLIQCAMKNGLKIHSPLSDIDADRLFADAKIFLSPVCSGTGIKIKTLEAMARGKPVVGFRGAFRGVHVVHSQQALIADTVEEFARMLESLVFDATRRHEIGTAARDFVRINFDPAILGTRLMRLYEDVAQGRICDGLQQTA